MSEPLNYLIQASIDSYGQGFSSGHRGDDRRLNIQEYANALAQNQRDAARGSARAFLALQRQRQNFAANNPLEAKKRDLEVINERKKLALGKQEAKDQDYVEAMQELGYDAETIQAQMNKRHAHRNVAMEDRLKNLDNFLNGDEYYHDPELFDDYHEGNINFLRAKYGNELADKVEEKNLQEMALLQASAATTKNKSAGAWAWDTSRDVVAGIGSGVQSLGAVARDVLVHNPLSELAGYALPRFGEDDERLNAILHRGTDAMGEWVDENIWSGIRSAENLRNQELKAIQKEFAKSQFGRHRMQALNMGIDDKDASYANRQVNKDYDDLATVKGTDVAEGVGNVLPVIAATYFTGGLGASAAGGLATRLGLSANAIAKASQLGSLAGTAGLSVLMNGGSSAGDAYTAIYNAEGKDLEKIKATEAYQSLIEQGNSHKEALYKLGSDAAQSAFAKTAAITGIASALGGHAAERTLAGLNAGVGSRLSALGRGMNKVTSKLGDKGKLGSGIGKVIEPFKEAGTEKVEEYAQTVNARNAVNDVLGTNFYKDPTQFADTDSDAAAATGFVVGSSAAVKSVGSKGLDGAALLANKAAEKIKGNRDAKQSAETFESLYGHSSYTDKDGNKVEGKAGSLGIKFEDSSFGQTYQQEMEKAFENEDSPLQAYKDDYKDYNKTIHQMVKDKRAAEKLLEKDRKSLFSKMKPEQRNELLEKVNAIDDVLLRVESGIRLDTGIADLENGTAAKTAYETTEALFEDALDKDDAAAMHQAVVEGYKKFDLSFEPSEHLAEPSRINAQILMGNFKNDYKHIREMDLTPLRDSVEQHMGVLSKSNLFQHLQASKLKGKEAKKLFDNFTSGRDTSAFANLKPEEIPDVFHQESAKLEDLNTQYQAKQISEGEFLKRSKDHVMGFVAMVGSIGRANPAQRKAIAEGGIQLLKTLKKGTELRGTPDGLIDDAQDLLQLTRDRDWSSPENAVLAEKLFGAGEKKGLLEYMAEALTLDPADTTGRAETLSEINNFWGSQRAKDQAIKEAIQKHKDGTQIMSPENPVEIAGVYQSGKGKGGEKGKPVTFTNVNAAEAYLKKSSADTAAFAKVAGRIAQYANNPYAGVNLSDWAIKNAGKYKKGSTDTTDTSSSTTNGNSPNANNDAINQTPVGTSSNDNSQQNTPVEASESTQESGTKESSTEVRDEGTSQSESKPEPDTTTKGSKSKGKKAKATNPNQGELDFGSDTDTESKTASSGTLENPFAEMDEQSQGSKQEAKGNGNADGSVSKSAEDSSKKPTQEGFRFEEIPSEPVAEADTDLVAEDAADNSDTAEEFDTKGEADKHIEGTATEDATEFNLPTDTKSETKGSAGSSAVSIGNVATGLKNFANTVLAQKGVKPVTDYIKANLKKPTNLTMETAHKLVDLIAEGKIEEAVKIDQEHEVIPQITALRKNGVLVGESILDNFGLKANHDASKDIPAAILDKVLYTMSATQDAQAKGVQNIEKVLSYDDNVEDIAYALLGFSEQEIETREGKLTDLSKTDLNAARAFANVVRTIAGALTAKQSNHLANESKYFGSGLQSFALHDANGNKVYDPKVLGAITKLTLDMMTDSGKYDRQSSKQLQESVDNQFNGAAWEVKPLSFENRTPSRAVGTTDLNGIGVPTHQMIKDIGKAFYENLGLAPKKDTGMDVVDAMYISVGSDIYNILRARGMFHESVIEGDVVSIVDGKNVKNHLSLNYTSLANNYFGNDAALIKHHGRAIGLKNALALAAMDLSNPANAGSKVWTKWAGDASKPQHGIYLHNISSGDVTVEKLKQDVKSSDTKSKLHNREGLNEVVREVSQVAHEVNQGFTNFMLNDSVAKVLFKESDVKQGTVSDRTYEAERAKQDQVVRSWHKIDGLLQAIEASGTKLSDALLTFDYGTTDNGRIMLKSSLNPQSDKWIREALTVQGLNVDDNGVITGKVDAGVELSKPTKGSDSRNVADLLTDAFKPIPEGLSDTDLETALYNQHLMLAVAQGLGVKIEKLRKKDIQAQLGNLFRKKSLNVKDMMEIMWETSNDQDYELSNPQQALLKAWKDKFGNDLPRALSAVSALAQYKWQGVKEHSVYGKDAKFNPPLYLEHDGITNGLHNIVRMFVQNMTPEYLHTMNQTGTLNMANLAFLADQKDLIDGNSLLTVEGSAEIFSKTDADGNENQLHSLDAYEAPAEALATDILDSFRNPNPSGKTPKRIQEIRIKEAEAVLTQLALLGGVSVKGSSQGDFEISTIADIQRFKEVMHEKDLTLNITRAVAKAGITPVLYAGGLAAVSNQLAKETLAATQAKLDKAMLDKDEHAQEEILSMMESLIQVYSGYTINDINPVQESSLTAKINVGLNNFRNALFTLAKDPYSYKFDEQRNPSGMLTATLAERLLDAVKAENNEAFTTAELSIATQEVIVQDAMQTVGESIYAQMVQRNKNNPLLAKDGATREMIFKALNESLGVSGLQIETAYTKAEEALAQDVATTGGTIYKFDVQKETSHFVGGSNQIATKAKANAGPEGHPISALVEQTVRNLVASGAAGLTTQAPTTEGMTQVLTLKDAFKVVKGIIEGHLNVFDGVDALFRRALQAGRDANRNTNEVLLANNGAKAWYKQLAKTNFIEKLDAGAGIMDENSYLNSAVRSLAMKLELHGKIKINYPKEAENFKNILSDSASRSLPWEKVKGLIEEAIAERAKSNSADKSVAGGFADLGSKGNLDTKVASDFKVIEEFYKTISDPKFNYQNALQALAEMAANTDAVHAVEKKIPAIINQFGGGNRGYFYNEEVFYDAENSKDPVMKRFRDFLAKENVTLSTTNLGGQAELLSKFLTTDPELVAVHKAAYDKTMAELKPNILVETKLPVKIDPSKPMNLSSLMSQFDGAIKDAPDNSVYNGSMKVISHLGSIFTKMSGKGDIQVFTDAKAVEAKYKEVTGHNLEMSPDARGAYLPGVGLYLNLSQDAANVQTIAHEMVHAMFQASVNAAINSFNKVPGYENVNIDTKRLVNNLVGIAQEFVKLNKSSRPALAAIAQLQQAYDSEMSMIEDGFGRDNPFAVIRQQVDSNAAKGMGVGKLSGAMAGSLDFAFNIAPDLHAYKNNSQELAALQAKALGEFLAYGSTEIGMLNQLYNMSSGKGSIANGHLANSLNNPKIADKVKGYIKALQDQLMRLKDNIAKILGLSNGEGRESALVNMAVSMEGLLQEGRLVGDTDYWGQTKAGQVMHQMLGDTDASDTRSDWDKATEDVEDTPHKQTLSRFINAALKSVPLLNANGELANKHMAETINSQSVPLDTMQHQAFTLAVPAISASLQVDGKFQHQASKWATDLLKNLDTSKFSEAEINEFFGATEGKGNIPKLIAMAAVNPDFAKRLESSVKEPDGKFAAKTQQLMNTLVDKYLFKDTDFLGKLNKSNMAQKLMFASLNVTKHLKQTLEASRRAVDYNSREQMQQKKMQEVLDSMPEAVRKNLGVTFFKLAVSEGASPQDSALGELLRDLINAREAKTGGVRDPLIWAGRLLLGASEQTNRIHELFGKAKFGSDVVREKVSSGAAAVLRNQFSRPLTEVEDAAIGAAVVPAMVHRIRSLEGLTTSNNPIGDALASKESRSDMISSATGELQHAIGKVIGDKKLAKEVLNYMSWQAEGLGQLMMTKEAKSSSKHGSWILPNAKAIASGIQLQELFPEKDVSALKGNTEIEEIVGGLASLYALNHASQEHLDALKSLNESEDEGFNFLLNGASAVSKGIAQYDPDSYQGFDGYEAVHIDPMSDVKLVPAKDQKSIDALVQKGYTQRTIKDGYAVMHTNMSPINDRTSGLFGITEATVKGANTVTGEPLHGITHKHDVVALLAHSEFRDAAMKAMANPDYYSSLNETSSLAPRVSRDGKMSHISMELPKAMRDEMLMVQDKGIEAIGNQRGRLIEEEAIESDNRHFVDQLREFYYDNRNTSMNFVKFDGKMKPTGNTNAHKQIADRVNEAFWALPASTRAYIKSVGGLHIPLEELDNIIGYKQLSVTDILTDNSYLPDMVKDTLKPLMGKVFGAFGSNPVKVSKAIEHSLNETASFGKDVILNKSLKVAAQNMTSNVIHLVNAGIPAKDIPGLLQEGLQAARKYHQDLARATEIEFELSILNSKHHATKIAKLKAEKDALVQSMDTNPTKPLMDEGMFSSITTTDIHGGTRNRDGDSMARRTSSKLGIDKASEMVPDRVAKVANNVLIREGSETHNFMVNALDYGDFVSKYAIYKHLTSKKGLPQKRVMNTIRDEFINYTVNRGQAFDYMNRMGITWFLSYKMGIQKVIFRRLRRNFLRTTTIYALGHTAAGESLVGNNIVPNQNLIWDGSLSYQTDPTNLLDAWMNHWLSMVF